MAKPPKKSHYIVILCGGTGPRLWPLSTANNPKQFLKITSTHSLLQETVSRCQKIVPSKHLFIISNNKYASKLRNLPGTIILEPEKKNTTTAILYAASKIFSHDPTAIITITPADHYIHQHTIFKQDIISAKKLAENGSIVTIGISPTSANPSYGYIKTIGQKTPYRVARFIEKPKIINAKRYIQNPSWFWNSGIYTFSFNTLKHALRVHNLVYYQLFEKLLVAKNQNDVSLIYSKSPNISFDRSISQRSHNLTMIRAGFDWNDVGEYKSIFKILPKNAHHIANLTPNSPVINIDSSSCLISSQKNKLIGLIGVKNLAIIDTPTGLLICKLPLSSQVRHLVATMVSEPSTIHYFEK